ncbi:MAG: hypothetical protein Q4F65_02715 [Propionibacteriaceae bacterium]|nr:hypothetical protein [Propionibacteriaceae bacterium]
MTTTTSPGDSGRTVNTVLGPVPADELGVVAAHEALLSVVPGAEHAPDITIDRAEVVTELVAQLNAFKAAGGGTVVDASGMFHGRNLPLLEAVSKATGVHIVASTGMGPEENLGGYFKTPQTNPPTPWPADRFAELFTAEVSQGMVVPRIERRAAAGLVVTAGTTGGLTGTDESLLRGAARTAAATGAPMAFRYGADAVAELDLVLAEEVDPARVLVVGLDSKDAAGAAVAVAEKGALVGLTQVGTASDDLLSDDERADLVVELVQAGHRDRVLVASGAIGVAKGLPRPGTAFEHVLTSFVPLLAARGLSDADTTALTTTNPATWLTIQKEA